jgi:hypothetical protein
MRFAGVKLDRQAGTISRRDGLKSDTRPLDGVTAAVELSGQDRHRYTATRLVTGGFLFGRAKKNVGGRQLWVRIVGPDFDWVVDGKMSGGVGADAANRQLEKKARKFAAEVNTAAKTSV